MSFFLRISVVSVILLLLTPIAPADELPKVTSKHWTNGASQGNVKTLDK